jgi:hypothetical protein
MSFSAIWLVWKWHKERIARLTRAAIRTRRYPLVGNQASGAVISKPGKDDYTKLKAYRSISLVSCMGKVDENFVAELLSEEDDRIGLLCDGQFGNRNERSAIDAAAIILETAHAACTNGHVTCVVLMHISVRNGPGRIAGFCAGFKGPGRAGDVEARATGGRPSLWFESLRASLHI